MRLLRILLLVLSPTAVVQADCGRLSSNDTYQNLNQILECLESRISELQKQETVQPTSTGTDSISSEQSIGDKEVEANNQITEANLITLGQRVRGKIADPEDRDFYRFRTTAQTEQVRVILRKLSVSGFYVKVAIFDEYEKKLKGDSETGDTPVSFVFESKPDAYHYVSVKPGGGRGEYELVIREEQ